MQDSLAYSLPVDTPSKTPLTRTLPATVEKGNVVAESSPLWTTNDARQRHIRGQALANQMPIFCTEFVLLGG